jgi:DNA polymerase elongation subunit (family B)
MTIKGADKLSYIFKEEDSRKEMSKALKMLMLKKYDGKVIYMHNGSKFDFTFILDALADLGKVDILMRKDNKILQVKWTFNTINPITEKPHSKPSKIIFYDSFNILDASLARLAQTFKVDHQKDIFAHD